jgi:hypothetical protein
MLAILLLTSALAANPLATGVRGIPWGEHATLPTPPGDCGEPGQLGIERSCKDTLEGNIPVTISYAFEEGLFHAALIQVEGAVACQDLRAYLDTVWGHPTPRIPGYAGAFDDVFYYGGMTSAALYDYNKAKDSCTVAATHFVSAKEVQKRRQARNKKVGGAL